MRLCVFVSNNGLNCFFNNDMKADGDLGLGMDSMSPQQLGQHGCTGLRIEVN